MRCCPKEPARKIPRSIYEDARVVARALGKTEAFEQSRHDRSDRVVDRLNAAVHQALAKPRVRDAIEKMAAEPAGGTQAAFGELVAAELARWSKVVKEAGIKMHE
jgi:hypothetical protein